MKKIILSILFFTAVLAVQAQTNYADSLFSAKQYNKALDAYYDDYRADVTNVHAMVQMAYIYSIAEGTGAQADIWYQKALKLKPDDEKINYQYAMYILENLEGLKPEVKAQEKEKAKKLLMISANKGLQEAKEELKKL